MAKDKNKDKTQKQASGDDFDFGAEGAEVESFDLEGWEDIKPQQNAPQGEYDLSIKAVKAAKSERTGRTGVMFVINIDNPPDEIERPRPIFHTLWFPMAGDDENKSQIMKEIAKETLDAFGYVPSQRGKIIPNEMNGLRAKALVNLVAPTPQNRLKAPRNEISRFLSGPDAPGINQPNEMF